MNNIYSIYRATNLITEKCYIGFDSNWPKRKSEHKSAAIRDKGFNKFYNSIKKYGWESFTWEVIYQSCDGLHCLNTMESYFISEYNSYHNGYNSTKGGESGLGNKWWNNGMVQVFTGFPPDESFVRGRLPFNNTGAQIGANIQKQKIWVNNGISEMMILKNTVPAGYTKGRLKAKAFAGGEGRHCASGNSWWNNGTIELMSLDCPGPGYIVGRLVTDTINKFHKERGMASRKKYEANPKHCLVCNEILPYHKQGNTCSKECSRINRSRNKAAYWQHIKDQSLSKSSTLTLPSSSSST